MIIICLTSSFNVAHELSFLVVKIFSEPQTHQVMFVTAIAIQEYAF